MTHHTMLRCLGLLLLSSVALPVVAQEPPEVDLLAYLPDLGAEISAEEVREHIQLYSEFLEESGVARPTVRIADDVAQLQELVQQRSTERPTIGVIHPLVVTIMGEQWKMTPLAFPVQDGSPTAPRVVVVLRESGIDDLDGLRGKSLVITRPWNELPELLGYMLWKRPERVDQVLGQLLLAETSAQAAAVVLQRKADAALLNRYVWDMSRKQSKRVWQNLEVVGETPETHLSVVVSFAGTPPELSDAILEAVLNAESSKPGKKLLEAFQLDGFQAASQADLARVEGKLIQELSPARRASSSVTQISADRMGENVGLTLRLPRSLMEDQSAFARYRVDEGEPLSANLRCVNQTCTTMVKAPAGAQVWIEINLRAADGTESVVDSYEMTAP